MEVQVIVENNTGGVVYVTGCGSLFQVALGNDAVKPNIGWEQCLETLTVAAGESTYTVAVSGSYLDCYGDGLFPACIDGRAPALPPGDYQAALYQNPEVAPAPPPIDIRVTS
jgi:hypothetical protein